MAPEATTPDVSQTSLVAASLLRGKIYALSPIDFDPLPAQMHSYAWLVAALEPLVTACEIRAHRNADDSDGDERVRSLRALWKSIHRNALVGWSSQTHAPPHPQDLEEFVFDQATRDRSWFQLGPSWNLLISKMVEELEMQRLIARGGLILLPIEDLDLHPHRAKELLLALRICHHPRLAFLVAGSVRHLCENLSASYFEDEIRAPYELPFPPDEARMRWKRARLLADDLVRKVLPDSLRFVVPLLDFPEALERLRRILSLPPSLETLLSSALSLHETAQAARLQMRRRSGFRLRDIESIAGLLAPEGDPQKQAATFFAILVRVDDGRVFSEESDWPLRLPEQLHLRPTSMGGGGVRVGRFGFMATSLVRVIATDANGRAEVCDPHILAAAFAGATDSQFVRWTESEISFLVESEFVVSSEESIRLGWPLAFPSASPQHFFQRLSIWRFLRALPTPQPKEHSIEAMVILWGILAYCEAHLLTPEQSGALAADIVRRPRPLADLYARAFRVDPNRSTGREPGLRAWLTSWFPVFSAPEYGLPRGTQDEIVELSKQYLGGRNPESVEAVWIANRRSVIRDCVQAHQKQDSAEPEREIDRLLSEFNVEPAPVFWRADRGANARWWTRPIDPTRSDIDFGSVRISENVRFSQLLASPHQPAGTLWTTSSIGRKLVGPALSALLARIATLEPHSATSSRRAAPSCVVALWKTIAEEIPANERPADIAEWLDTAPNAIDLVYTGPSLVLNPILTPGRQLADFSLIDCAGWIASFENAPMSEQDESALASTLIIAQAVAAERGFSPLDQKIQIIQPTFLGDKASLFARATPIRRHLDWEFARVAWHDVCGRAEGYLSRGKRQAVENWVVAQWFWIMGWALSGIPANIEKISFPVTEADFEVIRRSHANDARFLEWLDDLQLPGEMPDAFQKALKG